MVFSWQILRWRHSLLVVFYWRSQDFHGESDTSLETFFVLLFTSGTESIFAARLHRQHFLSFYFLPGLRGKDCTENNFVVVIVVAVVVVFRHRQDFRGEESSDVHWWRVLPHRGGVWLDQQVWGDLAGYRALERYPKYGVLFGWLVAWLLASWLVGLEDVRCLQAPVFRAVDVLTTPYKFESGVITHT